MSALATSVQKFKSLLRACLTQFKIVFILRLLAHFARSHDCITLCMGSYYVLIPLIQWYIHCLITGKQIKTKLTLSWYNAPWAIRKRILSELWLLLLEYWRLNVHYSCELCLNDINTFIFGKFIIRLKYRIDQCLKIHAEA